MTENTTYHDPPKTIPELIENLRNSEVIGQYSRFGRGGAPMLASSVASALESLVATPARCSRAFADCNEKARVCVEHPGGLFAEEENADD